MFSYIKLRQFTVALIAVVYAWCGWPNIAIFNTHLHSKFEFLLGSLLGSDTI